MNSSGMVAMHQNFPDAEGPNRELGQQRVRIFVQGLEARWKVGLQPTVPGNLSCPGRHATHPPLLLKE